MPRLLTQRELRIHLDSFRNALRHFNYSSIKNIVFLNLESFFSYMEKVPDNPFKRQYECLQKELDILQPYLPFTSSERASEFIQEMAGCSSPDQTHQVRQAFTQKLREDFIAFSRTLTTDVQWESVISTCEEIRQHKEELCLAHHSV